jgi:hypothetical protein
MNASITASHFLYTIPGMRVELITIRPGWKGKKQRMLILAAFQLNSSPVPLVADQSHSCIALRIIEMSIKHEPGKPPACRVQIVSRFGIYQQY